MIDSIRHSYPEKAGFIIDRTTGHRCYTFLHFFNSVELLSNGALTVTEPHACMIYEPHEPQYFKSVVPLVHDWIHFTNIDRCYFEEIGIPLNTVFYPKRHEFITRITWEIENEFNSQYQGKERMLESKFNELFIKLSRCIGDNEVVSVNKELTEQLRELRQKTFSNLGKNHTVKDMARDINLSESRFFTVYKALFGISPIEDLIVARIESAKNSLVTGNVKIETLAYSLGYSNVTHFIRQFRKLVGVSPSSYRKNN